MYRSLTVLAFLTMASAAQAQDWNRRISDVHIVHPPATPPGTWRVVATVEMFVTDNAPVPMDYSFDLRLSLNGTPIGLTPVPVFGPNAPSCAPGGGGPCSTSSCSGINNGAGNISGVCGLWLTGVGPNAVCGCRTPMGDFDFGTAFAVLHPMDLFTVDIQTGPGTLRDYDTSDDTFSIRLQDNPLGTPFCFGDSSSPVACPCGNSGASGHGCANSANPDGALLTARGWFQDDPTTGTDLVVLHGSGMPATSTAIYLKGSTNAGAAIFGDGLLCAGGSLIRLRTKINVGGASMFPELGDPSLSVRGATPPGSGLTGYYQVYYRNAAAAFCPPATFNVSGGTQIDW